MTISCEGAEVCREHIAQNRDTAPDNYVILNAALSQAMADDYILSARLRTRVMQNLNEIFSKVFLERKKLFVVSPVQKLYIGYSEI